MTSTAQLANGGIARALHDLKIRGFEHELKPRYKIMPRGLFGSKDNASQIGQASILYDVLADRGHKCYGYFYGYRGRGKLFRFQVQLASYGVLAGFSRKAWIQFSSSVSGPGLVRDGPVIEGGQSRLFTPKVMGVTINNDRTLFRHGLDLDNPGVVTAIAIDWTGPPTAGQAFEATMWLAQQLIKEIRAGDRLLAQARVDLQLFDRLVTSMKRKNGQRRAHEMAQELANAYEGIKPPELVAALVAHELTKTG